MMGKDWFILGIRLLGLGILYLGIQEVLAYVFRDMLFASVELAYFPQPNSGWSRLFHGGANVGMALLALTKAKTFANWCYGTDVAPIEDRDFRRDVETTADDDFPSTST